MQTFPNADDDFNKFLSPDNFQLAWRRIRNSTRLEVKDRLSLKIFSGDLNAHIEILIDELKNNQFIPASAEHIYAPKKSRTLRPFPFLGMRDRLVYQALGNIIIRNSLAYMRLYTNVQVFSPVVQSEDSDFIFENTKSTKNRPGQFKKFVDAIKSTKHDPSFHFFVRADISAFYPSIDHSLLFSQLEKYQWLSSPALLDLLKRCLEAWSSTDNTLKFQRGVPIGYETSDILGSLFLWELDKSLVKHCKVLRYVDDMYLFTSTKSEAIYALMQLDLALQHRLLNLP